MGTSNFHKRESKVFHVVELRDEFDYDDICENVECCLNNMPNGYGEQDNKWKDSTSKILGGLWTDKDYCNMIDIKINITITINSGYYQHCNLDYFSSVDVGGVHDNDIDCINAEWIAEELVEYGMTNKQAIYRSKQIMKWIVAETVRLKDQADSLFSDYSDSYKIAYQFSNGETGYERAINN